MTQKLTGKVAFVTGASSGIGEATTVALAEQGARVAVLARRADRLEQVVKQIKDAGGEALPMIADVTNEGQLRAAIRQTKEIFGRIDILVNNAGVMLLHQIEGVDTREGRQMLDLNVLAVMLACQEVLPIMQAQGGGHIVNISSVAGRLVKAGYSGYNASKWAMGAFSESLRKAGHRAAHPSDSNRTGHGGDRTAAAYFRSSCEEGEAWRPSTASHPYEARISLLPLSLRSPRLNTSA
jgi:NADP-dependent 3-hydroxy acid dehydrogenase YdfG